MSFIWLLVLVIYGLGYGFGTVPLLAWLMTLPLLTQDLREIAKERGVCETVRGDNG